MPHASGPRSRPGSVSPAGSHARADQPSRPVPSALPATSSPHSPRDLSTPLPGVLSWTVLIAFVVVFTLAYFALNLPGWMPALYAAMSLLSFVAYGADKSAAGRGRRRLSERTLLTLGLLGGWPGALVAQQVFRHKTRKRSFRRAFWTSVVLNIAALGGIVTLAAVKGWDLQIF